MENGYLSPQYRRSYKRFEADLSAALLINRHMRGPSIIKDLSARGAGVVTDYPLDKGQEVELAIPECFFFSEAVNRKAKVVWCRQAGERFWQAGLDFGEDNKLNFG